MRYMTATSTPTIGRPRGRRQIAQASAYLDATEMAALDELAERHGLSKSQVLRRCVRLGIEVERREGRLP